MPAGRVVIATGVSVRIGRAKLRALLRDADEPRVVAADPDRDQRRIRAQRVELRRVGAAERDRLGLGHVDRGGAAAADVGERAGGDYPRDV